LFVVGVLVGFAVGLAVAYAVRSAARRRERLAEFELSRLGRERDQAAERAGRLEECLVAVSGSVLESILIVDTDLRVSRASRGAMAIFERDETALGRSVMEFTRASEIHQLVVDAIASGWQADGPSDELDRLIPIGERPFRVRAVAFRHGVALALSDLSELQRLGRARRDFVANISHEWRTPLTSIRLLVETLLTGAHRSRKEGKAILRKIEAEVDVLQQMAQELLDLSLIESGQAPLRMVPTPVTTLIDGVLERLAAQSRLKRLTTHVEVAPDLVALADPELAARAIANVYQNAVKFTPPSGEIWIRAGPSDGDVVIEVTDTGPGIGDDDLPRVFERFFRGDQARAGGGTGLGLSIAKHIVESHGGAIWARSHDAPGLGATVGLTLPAADGAGDGALKGG
jgi:two-component system phosphate regulon sensor histidine kinase PhoR